MDIDRRSFLFASMLLMSGCGQAAPPKAKPKAAAPAAARVLAGWDDFKARFLLPEGRIADSGNGGISHSEGQGYGLVLAEAAGDRATFDRLLGWTEATLARPHDALFSWRFEPGKGVTDPNDASDGDILIAWALMRAATRWHEPRYEARAAAIRNAIAQNLVHSAGKRTLLLPGITGFEQPDRVTINLSYYIWPALDAFRAADGAGPWGQLIKDGEALLAAARSGPLQLPTDWTDVTPDGSAAPALGRPPRFGFDAVRIPLYLSLGGRKTGAESIAHFWRSYADNGQPIPAWVDVQTGQVAEYALSEGSYAIVRRLIGPVASTPQGTPDYYSSVIGLLAQL